MSSQDAWDLTTKSGIDMLCYDSVLLNGKGQVDCWPEEKIAALLTPAQQTFLQLGNGTVFTPKGVPLLLSPRALPVMILTGHETVAYGQES